MPSTRGDQDRVSRADLAHFSVDLHRAASLEDVVDLLAEPVVVPLRRSALRQTRLGETLILHRSVGVIEEAADRGSIGGGEGGLGVTGLDDHDGGNGTSRIPLVRGADPCDDLASK